MTEEDELQAKIAALSGRISQHKQSTHAPHPSHNTYSPRGTSRWAPYSTPHTALYQNRTLVLTGNGVTPPATRSAPLTPPSSDAPDGYVALKGRKQLMTQKTFEREANQMVDYNGTRLVSNNAHQQERQLVINGIRFRMELDGSKMIRVNDNDAAKETPKTATVAGVTFLRTNRGNLARATLPAANEPKRTTKTVQCQHFTKNGTCPFGPGCRFAHDPNKIAMCKDFLHSGSCLKAASCDLSHDSTYHRAPACAHFLRGNCTNDACRYPHIFVSPSAPVCRAFATFGYCPRGPKCDKRHVTECPDYANHGHCASREDGKCKLPHPLHASTLRKAEQRRAKMAAGGSESDLSSDDDRNSSDDMQINVTDNEEDDDIVVTLGSDAESHQLSQQQDYVSLG